MEATQATHPPLEKGRTYRMSYQEYLDLIPESWQAEWADGEVYVFLPPTVQHQLIIVLLMTVLGSFVRFFRLGEVFPILTEMRVRPDGPSRQPDIMFIARENANRISEYRIEGPADLIVEVVSDDTVNRDYDVKLAEYQTAGVHEYWVLDARPGREEATFFVLDTQGRYQAVPTGPDGVYHSTVVPGFWFRPEWLFMPELPDTFGVFAEIVGFPPHLVEQLRQSVNPPQDK